ncbi:helix-turn-helix domain-containing protein [Arthrobacter sp. NPDC093128]|uniref:helix-turn-helix domain-containing protein n=1 Tax=Arthrobacter sp. NPDC093128 TaxID=3154979 RepID=UPI0034334E3D
MSPSQDLSADEWEDAVSRSFVPLRVSQLSKCFVGHISRQQLDSNYGLSRVKCEGSVLNRTPDQANGDSAQSVLFVTHLRGQARVSQNGRLAAQKPGHSVLYLTDRPYELDFPTAIDEVVLQVPAAALSTRRRRLDELAARSFEPTMPFRLLQTYIMQLSIEGTGRDSAGLGRVAAELLDVALGSVDGTYVNASGDATYASVKQFVREHACDANLDPSTVAAAFHISLRQLYNLFTEAGQSPAEMIRQRRLDLAQGMLVNDPKRPVATIAYECGFTDSSTFTRAFRANTGQTPAAYRRERALIIAGS